MLKLLALNYRFLSHPLLIGAVLAAVTLLIAPPVISKYTVTSSLTFAPNNQLKYTYKASEKADTSVLVNLFIDRNSNFFYKKGESKDLDKQDFSRRNLSKLLFVAKPHCTDIDLDGRKEILFLSARKDTLFLFIHDLMSGELKRRTPVLCGFPEKKMIDINPEYLGTDNSNPNKDPEFYFAVRKAENKIWKYNYRKDSLTNKSQFKGQIVKVFKYHINDDESVFIVETSQKGVKFDELIVLNKNLEQILLLRISGSPGLYTTKNEQHLLMCDINDSLSEVRINATLQAGKLVCRKIDLPESLRINRIANDNGYKVYAITRQNKVSSVTEVDLLNNKVNTFSYDDVNSLGGVYYVGDIDENGKCDLLTTNAGRGKEALMITESADTKHAVSIPINREQLYIYNVAKLSKGKLLVQMYGANLTVEYGVNPNYRFRWLEYLLIFIAYYLVTLLIQFLTRKRQEELSFYKNRMVELQLRNMRDRVDPHFVFNAINSSASFLLCGDRMEAYNYLSKLTGLLRYSLKNADQVMCPLKDEIQNCRHYLDIQKMRFTSKFDYAIHLSENINQEVKIPPGILVNLSENCIKHGFNGKESGGLIDIRIDKTKTGLLLNVKDNGIGRAEAKCRSKSRISTGTGENVIKQYVRLLNRTNKSKLSFTIRDLVDERGKACGTQCEFFLPDNLNY